MTEEINLPADEKPELPEHSEVSESQTGGHKRRRRIKIKKRIKQRVRIKKKPSLKKRVIKWMGYLAWIIVIGGFLITVFVLVKELDIKDENAKKQAPKKKQVDRSLNNMKNGLLGYKLLPEKVIHFQQTENSSALNSLA
jgi:hypothetical protein